MFNFCHLLLLDLLHVLLRQFHIYAEVIMIYKSAGEIRLHETLIEMFFLNKNLK